MINSEKYIIHGSKTAELGAYGGWVFLATYRAPESDREVQAMKASARATKATAVVRLAGDQSSFSEVITCTFIIVELVLILIKFLFDYLFITGMGD